MDNKKVSENRVKKEGIVAEIKTKADKSKGFVFTNYQGLTHKQIEDLKKSIKGFNAEFVIAKNTLLERAIPDVKELETVVGPTGTIFVYEDFVSPLKELAKLIKNLGMPSIKFGVLEGKTLNSEEVLKISTLPTKEVLLAQLVGGLKSPIFGLHRALNWNLQKLAMTLKSIEERKNEVMSSSAKTGVADEQNEEVKGKNG